MSGPIVTRLDNAVHHGGERVIDPSLIARRAAQKQYRDSHRAIRAEALRKWRRANPEKAAAQSRKWNAANPDKRRDISRRAWLRNQAKCRASGRRYKARHPEANVIRENRRRAKLNSAPGRGVTVGAWAEILSEFGHLCAYCASPGKMFQEHVDPISRNGAHDPDNIVPACLSCNSSKRSSTLLEWFVRKVA